MTLSTSVDTTYADSGTDASVKQHQQDHDVVHGAVNALAGGVAGQVPSKASAADYDYGWQTPGGATGDARIQGLAAWAFDLLLCTGSAVNPTSGTILVAKVPIPVSMTITNLHIYIGSAGASLTSGQNFCGLYDTSGARLGVTADQSTNWTSTGLMTMPLTSSVAVPGGPTAAVFVAFLPVGSTRPSIVRGTFSISGVPNAGLTGLSSRFGSADTGQTSLPTTLGTITPSLTSAYWMAVS